MRGVNDGGSSHIGTAGKRRRDREWWGRRPTLGRRLRHGGDASRD
jgi:hypothetical protein